MSSLASHVAGDTPLPRLSVAPMMD